MNPENLNTGSPEHLNTEHPFPALRRFARQAPIRIEERCDLCAEAIGPEHRHLLDLPTRQVLCACRACAFLLAAPAAGAGTRLLIPTRTILLTDSVMTDRQWDALQIPVQMAFCCYNTAAQRMMAFYPSPMGPTESALPPTAWDELAETNPLLQEMEPDVEALLIHRGREQSAYFLAPIDNCYRLVGLVRTHWKGIGGGSDVRKEIDRFFAELHALATGAGGIRNINARP